MRHLKPILVSVLGILSGCSVAQGVVDLPGNAVRAVAPGEEKAPPPDPVKLQERMLRFADEYETEMNLTLERLPRGEAPLDAKTILQLKWTLSSAVIGMASGANPRASLLDLTAFATVTRMAVESHWLPRPFGESVKPVHQAALDGEARAWTLAAQILTAEEQERFRAGILAWFEAHPRPESIFAARSAGLAEEAVLQGNASKDSGHFITLDPLSNLDPAVREITQARMLGERALFVADRLPRRALWQSELMAMSLLETPALKQVVATSVEQAESGAKELVDYVVARLAFLVILVLGAALFYRWLAPRMAAQRSAKPS